MKKYLAFFLLLSVTALVYGRPQKLVIKTDKESVELRYWPLDGKQLPFYSLYSPVIVFSTGTEVIGSAASSKKISKNDLSDNS